MVVTKIETYFPWRGFRAVAPACSGTSQLAESQEFCHGLLCPGKGATQQNAHLDSPLPYAHDLSTQRADKLCKATLLLSHRTGMAVLQEVFTGAG